MSLMHLLRPRKFPGNLHIWWQILHTHTHVYCSIAAKGWIKEYTKYTQTTHKIRTWSTI